jgi:hypothetical protein
VWREAAWYHLLFDAGKYAPALARLGTPPQDYQRWVRLL